MSNFDIDDFLFGDLDSQDNKKQKGDKKEKEKEIKPTDEEQPEHHEKPQQKTEDYSSTDSLEKTKEEELLTAEDASSSSGLMAEREDHKHHSQEIQREEAKEKPEFPEWTDVNQDIQSREDIIKGIDFSGEGYPSKKRYEEGHEKQPVDTVEVKETLRSQEKSKTDDFTSPEVTDTLPSAEDEIQEKVQEDSTKEQTLSQSTKLPKTEETPQVETISKEVEQESKDKDTESPIPPTEDKEPVHPTKKKNSLVHFILYLILVVLIAVVLILIYINRDSIPIFQDDSATYIVQDIEQEDNDETKEDDENDFDIDNNLDKSINKLLNGHYRILDSGGLALDYTEVVDGEEQRGSLKLTLGDEADPTYLHEGQIRYFNPGEGKEIVWDEEGNKYIMSEENNTYFVVDKYSDLYYRNFVGQHILQDLIDDYTRNKNVVNQIDENTWSWDWTFYTPVNDYRTRKVLNTQIILDPENSYIEKIVLENEKSFEFKFDFVALDEPYDKEYIPSDYNLVEEEEFEV